MSLSFSIFDWVLESGFCEAFQSEPAGVASAAACAVVIGVVAAMGEGVIDAELRACGYGLAFGHLDNRRMDFVPTLSLDGGCGGEVGGILEGGDEFGPELTPIKISKAPSTSAQARA